MSSLLSVTYFPNGQIKHVDRFVCQLTMMRDGNPNAFTRQVHFANGFPPKGFVQDASPYYGGSPHSSPRGHCVSLVSNWTSLFIGSYTFKLITV